MLPQLIDVRSDRRLQDVIGTDWLLGHSVTINGGLISLDDLKDSAPAILNAGMPGVQGGTAIAATIFGENNPGGKLPVTMYHSSYINETDFLNMSMTNGVGRSCEFPEQPAHSPATICPLHTAWSEPQPPPTDCFVHTLARLRISRRR